MRISFAILLAALIVSVAPVVLRAQGADDLAALQKQVSRLHGQGKYGEALLICERYVALARERFGEDHREFATAIGWLGHVYRAEKRYAQAEPLLRRSAAIYEKSLGPEHFNVSTALSNLASLYGDVGRYPEAEALFKRALAIEEKLFGTQNPRVGNVLSELGRLYQAQGRYAEAESLYVRALSTGENMLNPQSLGVASMLDDLASVYKHQGRYAEAEPLYRRTLAITITTRGLGHAAVGRSYSNLAEVLRGQGRYEEAEPLHRRAIAVVEKALGPDHAEIAAVIHGLAGLLAEQGRYSEAEPLYRRALEITEKAHGPDDREVGTFLNDLAAVLEEQGNYSEAEALYVRALVVTEKALGASHPDVGASLNNLALLQMKQGRYGEAEPLLERALANAESALGPDHLWVGIRLHNLGDLHREQQRYASARSLHERSLAILEKVLGPQHHKVATSLGGLATLAFVQRDWERAAEFWRRSSYVLSRRTQATARTTNDGSQPKTAYWRFVKAAYHLAAQRSRPDSALLDEAFVSAQRAFASEAARSVAQMTARAAKNDPSFSKLVRELQDLAAVWQAEDKSVIAAVSQPAAKRDMNTESKMRDRVAAMDMRISVIEYRLRSDFPDYWAVSRPEPLSTGQVQAELKSDEVLVLFLDTPDTDPLPEETFIWVVTKSSARWVRSDMGKALLTREVAALRCGLDAAAWDGDGREYCTKALSAPLTKPLRFDHARAHKLYAALFGQVQDLIKGKHLLIVPSGALTQLPFHVLVTKPPTSRESRAISWLVREHAVTVLPAVSSLKALRGIGRPSAASRPMIGFGNPLLDGPDGRFASLAKLAQAKQSCPTQRPQALARSDHRAMPSAVETRGGLANVLQVKKQVPLPETADELCAVGQAAKADTARDILLGAKATEREIKRLSATGELAQYRTVHFATHGVLAGELRGSPEPGLILTPPDTATEEDDGYLSASEIAALKLDADWVILSACNTAAGGSMSAETLSGLARAFIYAQARALLVSHWAVYSDATVKLVTAAAREMARDAEVGRAEALRRSMVALLDKGTPQEAHPAYWAPFVVVGEGAVRR